MTDIIDVFPDPALVVDSRSYVVAWNSAIENLNGVDRSDVVGKGNFTHAIPFYGAPRPLLLDLIGSPDPDLIRMYPSPKRNDRVLHAQVFAPALNGGQGAFLSKMAAPLSDMNGNPIGAIEIVREISGKQGIEMDTGGVTDGSLPSSSINSLAPGSRNDTENQALGGKGFSSLVFLANALTLARDCILILDLTARCVWANDALVSLVGAQGRADLMGKSLATYIAPEHRKTMLDNLSRIRKEKYQCFDMMFLSSLGRVQLEASVSAIPDETGGVAWVHDNSSPFRSWVGKDKEEKLIDVVESFV